MSAETEERAGASIMDRGKDTQIRGKSKEGMSHMIAEQVGYGHRMGSYRKEDRGVGGRTSHARLKICNFCSKINMGEWGGAVCAQKGVSKNHKNLYPFTHSLQRRGDTQLHFSPCAGRCTRQTERSAGCGSGCLPPPPLPILLCRGVA